ncbi:PPK2 family polyphosphate kinase [Ascidiimonas aurantiaca]|uniref:PPK2 family polyphosphate kinase n=1 Tax=Ascidiimonas aurantiaca TaxID=1685432 RepID=UPI0030EBAD1C
MKKIVSRKYKVDSPISLQQLSTYEDLGADEDSLKEVLRNTRKKLGKFQDTMYAHGKYSVLICLQGMDTAGKDSLVREVFKDFNSRGVVVHSFKVPSTKELKHDYLWRHYIALPERGKFGVFNRTHYENVLVTRVHPDYILNENLPDVNSVEEITSDFWNKRFEQIRNFEKHITQNGTIVFKFFLHLSKSEQKKRLLRRIDRKEKNWKFSAGDLKERKLWDRYQVCYEDAINRTSRSWAPWYIIPADNKNTARLIVAHILLEYLTAMKDIDEPRLDAETLANLEMYKKELESE